ncbi:MAG: DUF839 domain-containing protein [Bdellovibrionales bacterium]|nr:DUF839 domain-containing protein [Bdellovibrionales bacterium]
MKTTSKSWNRRKFLEFMGRTAAVGAVAGVGLPSLSALSGLSRAKAAKSAEGRLPFKSLKPQISDQVVLADGFMHEILIRFDDVINSKGERFGFNNDFINFVELNGKNDLLLWVNHEYTSHLLVSGLTEEDLKAGRKTKDQAIREQDTVGGSILRVKRGKDGRFAVVKNDPLNRRITGRTPIPMIVDRPIQGTKTAIGTISNCAGGKTPWGTFLTCEENYDGSYGEAHFAPDGTRTLTPSWADGWETYFPYPPEHYGWVVEVEPKTGAAKKLTGLGRFCHECATTVRAKSGMPVVYTGDDANDEFIYKFISKEKNSLERGTLYVADTVNGRWLPLDLEQDARLKKAFKDQTELLIRTREAARIVGATPQDRPEDVGIDPATGAVLVALTNNKKKGNFHGSLLKIEEKGGDYGSLDFKASTFLAGGTATGFSCPDNMAFDLKGNLWITSDISGSSIGKNEYTPFGNNGLFYVPLSGPEAGKVFQVASAPKEAELTGPCFSPDGRTLFLSVQHPGEESPSLDALTSHWPDGGSSKPTPAVIQISGPALDALIGAKA